MNRYDKIIGPWGYTVVAEWDEDDYQGNSIVVFQDGDKFGLLEYSWGSCSGCDALEACGGEADEAKLSEEMKGQIKWFGSAAAIVSTLQQSVDPNGYGSDRDTSGVPKIIEALKGR